MSHDLNQDPFGWPLPEPIEVKEETHLLLKAVLEFKEDTWLSAAKIKALAPKLGVNELDDQIYFYRELLDIARQIPQKIYGESRVRVKFLELIQAVLDEFVAMEEG